MAATPGIRDVPGIRVGHATDPVGRTGCTVVLAEGGAIAGVDVRGSAPGTRETDLLRPTALVERIHAIFLTGGSAFGLAAADGVMRRLAERGIGFPTGVRPVPLVPAAVIFDLGVGSPDATPTADDGYAATLAAEDGAAGDGALEGQVGAGTGASVGTWAGPQHAGPGGVGSWSARLPSGATVGALVVTNALGNVVGRDGRTLAGARDEAGGFADPKALTGEAAPSAPWGNTTLAVVATDMALDRAGCRAMAVLAHDALAQAISPVHTPYDGDTVFVLSTAESGAPAGPGPLLTLGMVVVDVLRTAIERSVRSQGDEGS
jgi:L-aminopeptidase/D-esterase-like protein